MSELPEGWALSDIGSVCQYIQRGKSPKYDKDSEEYPVINQKCIRWDQIQSEHLKYVTADFWNGIDDIRFLQKGDVLWNSTGTGTIGRAAIFDGLSGYPKAIVDSHVTILRVHTGIDAKYLHYWIQSPDIQNKIEDMQSGTTNQVELSKGAIQVSSIYVAPEKEQKRIADKLDQILEEVNSAKARLDQIPTILKNFRRSVLRSAIAGKLSDNYKNKDKSLDEYLKTLLDDRKSNYQGGKNYKDPEAHRVDYLEEFPNHWGVVSLDYLSSKIVDGTHHTPTYTETGVPFISVKDIRNDQIYFEKCRYVSEETHEELIKRCHPERGDILITKSGTIGRLAVIDIDTKFSLFVSVALIKLASQKVSSHYITFVLEDWINRIDISSQIVGTAIKNLHLRDMRVLPIPLPSYEEQQHIISRVRELLSLADQIEEKYRQAMESVDKITQSILVKAFRGELVPQDPNEEPASILLERIKAEKELQELAPKQRRRKITKKNQEIKEMILSIIETLEKEKKPLSAQALLQKSGYPVDSDPEKIEEFFLDIKKSLHAGTIIRERVKDEDIFKLAA
jgi:type I restriction enzyme S subunit